MSDTLFMGLEAQAEAKVEEKVVEEEEEEVDMDMGGLFGDDYWTSQKAEGESQSVPDPPGATTTTVCSFV